MTYNRERYNASKRPSWSADELRAEFDRVQRGIPHPTAIDLRDFGPRKNGVSDDQTAIQRAVNAANDNGGGTVFFPRGSYAIASFVTLRDNVHAVFQRGAKIVISPDFAGSSTAFLASSKTNVVLDGLEIDCTEAPAAIAAGVSATTCTGLRIRRPVIYGSTRASGSCIAVTGGSDIEIEDGELYDFERGTTVMTSAAQVRVRRMRVHDVTEFGMYFLGSDTDNLDEVTVEDCRVWDLAAGASYPIYFTTGGAVSRHSRVRVTGNRVLGNQASFTSGNGTADQIALYSCEDFICEQNHSYYGGDIGIVAWNSRRGTIGGNVAAFNHSVGIEVLDSDDVTVVGNNCYDNYQDYGAVLNHATHRGGIRFSGTSTDCISTGNRCFDDGSAKQEYGVVIQSTTTRCYSIADHLDGNTVAEYSNLGADGLVLAAREGGLELAVRAASDVALDLRVNGDANPRIAIRPDSIRLGDGTGAVDAFLERRAAGSFGLTSNIVAGSGSVIGRVTALPSAAVIGVAAQGAASQTADLYQARIDGGSIRWKVEKEGIPVQPSLSTAQRDALATPADGMTLYNTSLSRVQARISSAWANMLSGGEISPAQITADQNNYAPTGGAAVLTWRLSSDASRNITGISGSASTDRHLRLVNVGAQNIVLQNQNASSTDSNRVITGTGADITIAPDDVVNLWYDGTTARWRVTNTH